MFTSFALRIEKKCHSIEITDVEIEISKVNEPAFVGIIGLLNL
jgi:hypothetical protein